MDAEAVQHVGKRIGGEFRLAVVPRSVESHHQAVAEQGGCFETPMKRAISLMRTAPAPGQIQRLMAATRTTAHAMRLMAETPPARTGAARPTIGRATPVSDGWSRVPCPRRRSCFRDVLRQDGVVPADVHGPYHAFQDDLLHLVVDPSPAGTPDHQVAVGQNVRHRAVM